MGSWDHFSQKIFFVISSFVDQNISFLVGGIFVVYGDVRLSKISNTKRFTGSKSKFSWLKKMKKHLAWIKIYFRLEMGSQSLRAHGRPTTNAIMMHFIRCQGCHTLQWRMIGGNFCQKGSLWSELLCIWEFKNEAENSIVACWSWVRMSAEQYKYVACNMSTGNANTKYQFWQFLVCVTTPTSCDVSVHPGCSFETVTQKTIEHTWTIHWALEGAPKTSNLDSCLVSEFWEKSPDPKSAQAQSGSLQQQSRHLFKVLKNCRHIKKVWLSWIEVQSVSHKPRFGTHCRLQGTWYLTGGPGGARRIAFKSSPVRPRGDFRLSRGAAILHIVRA